jgi:hypothetical protein
MNRGDCCQDKAIGIKIYVDDKLCGEWPNSKATWVTITCPFETKGTFIKIEQPRKLDLTVCGIQVFG